MNVTVLYTRQNSNYNKLLLDTWDYKRNALNWPGGNAIIAHPPCKAWGKLRAMAKPLPGEKQLAIHAIIMIRLWGGVLEHPRGSQLWKTMNLPKPGSYDQYGGWTLNINQHWWGHKAKKDTLLYIRGCTPKEIPPIPYTLNAITHNIGGAKKGLKQMGKKENEDTPINFAIWLTQLTTTINNKLHGGHTLAM